ncbi:hypothetical protein NDU88_006280 [Pleurodeles waltl]|uniref:Uncharacterized protein n=1 Tax=Pleurodeles waltl TaxID=8319 RepID=A0AAV7UKI2_PLEWA|nr:hypothetical protein NDU88_006280 [Pleurodeles waltl]
MEQYTTPAQLPQHQTRMGGPGEVWEMAAPTEEPSHAELLAAIQGYWVVLEGKIEAEAVEMNLIQTDLHKVSDKVKVMEWVYCGLTDGVVRCHTVNPETFFAHPVTDDEQVHGCANYVTEEESKVRKDPFQVTQQQKCTTAAQQISSIPVDQNVYVRNFVRRWKDSKFEGPYPVTQSTPTAVKVESRKPWIYLSDIQLAPGLCQTSSLGQELLEKSE